MTGELERQLRGAQRNRASSGIRVELINEQGQKVPGVVEVVQTFVAPVVWYTKEQLIDIYGPHVQEKPPGDER